MKFMWQNMFWLCGVAWMAILQQTPPAVRPVKITRACFTVLFDFFRSALSSFSLWPSSSTGRWLPSPSFRMRPYVQWHKWLPVCPGPCSILSSLWPWVGSMKNWLLDSRHGVSYNFFLTKIVCRSNKFSYSESTT